MRCIELLYCRWPWGTSSPPKHPNFYSLRRLSYLSSEWTETNLACRLIVLIYPASLWTTNCPWKGRGYMYVMWPAFKLQAKGLTVSCALFAFACLEIENWPDNLPMSDRNFFLLLLRPARGAKGCIAITQGTQNQVFRPTGATRCTDFGKIWHGVDRSMPNFAQNAWVGA